MSKLIPSGRDWINDLNNLAKNSEEMFGNLPSSLALMMTSKSGREFLGFQLGIEFTEWAIKNQMSELITANTEYLASIAADMAAESGTAVATASIVGAISERALMEVTLLETVNKMAKMLSDAVDEAASIMAILQMVGMFLDAVDPDGYNQELDPDMIESIQQTFDNAVSSQLLNNHNRLPLEYYAEYLLMDVKRTDDEIKADTAKSAKYYQEYLTSLTVNAFGEVITWDLGNDLAPTLDKEGFLNLSSLVLANSNTVVAAWIRNHWLVLIGLFIGVMVIFILLNKKKS